MLKACSRCGKMHRYDYVCYKGKIKKPSKVQKLRDSYAWEQKSLEIRTRAGWLCELCRTQGMYVYHGLEVHHIEPIRDQPDKYLDDDNLVCLCGMCHKMADKGEISRLRLYDLVKKRESTGY